VRVLCPIGEDEVIAAFLRAEIESSRYGGKLRALLVRDGRDPDVLSRPDLADADESRYRRRLLDEHRAYDRREEMFGGFPRRLEWFRAALTPDEVLEILYIDWDWWLMVSSGSRRPVDAARRIRAGEIPGVTVEEHEPIAASLRTSPKQPELIAVTTADHSRLVVVEGHVRLTAYALFPAYLSDELEIILGVSDEVAGWWAF
jgi:nucleotide-binding universal stress UspA family protein